MKWDSIRAAVDLHFWNWGRKDEKRVSNTSNERLWTAYFSVAQALIYPAHSLLCLCAVCITIMHPLHSVSSSISFPSAWPHPMEVLRSEHFHLGNFKLFLPESAVITRVLSHFPVGTETRQVWLLQEDLSCNIRAQGQRHLKLGWTLAHTGLLATPQLLILLLRNVSSLLLQSLVVTRRAQWIISFVFFKHPVHTFASSEAFLERKCCYGTQLLTTAEEENKMQFVEVNGNIFLELCGLLIQS